MIEPQLYYNINRTTCKEKPTLLLSYYENAAKQSKLGTKSWIYEGQFRKKTPFFGTCKVMAIF